MYFSVSLARSRCHSHLTMYKFCIVDVRVAVINVFIVAMDMEQFAPFAVLSRYKLFRTAVTDIRLPRISGKVPRYFCPI